MRNRIFNLLLILTLFTSCSSNKPDFKIIFKDNNQFFENNKTILNNGVKQLEKFYSDSTDINGFSVNYLDSLTLNLKNDLTNIGINGISIHSNVDSLNQMNYRISFNVAYGWNIETLRFLQIIYAPKDKNTIKGYHNYDGYHIDIWGQGDNFYLISDTDWL